MSKYNPRLVPLDRAEGIRYDGRTIIKLQAGITYSVIEIITNLLNRGTLYRAAIDLNGTEICYASGDELHYVDRVLKKHTQTGRFVFDLARFEYRSMVGIRQKELITLPTDEVTLLLDFKPKADSDPDSLSLRANAWVLNNQSARYFIPDMYRLTQNIAAAGEHEFSFPGGSVNRFIQRLCFKEDVANVSKIEVWRGATRVFSGTREDVEFGMVRHSNQQRAIIPGYFVFEPTLLGFGTHGAMQMGPKDSLKIKLFVDAAGPMEVFVEGYTQIQAINQATA